MGEPWATIWGVCLALGSLTSIIGSYWKDQIDGMLIERSGVFLLGCTAAVYAVLILLFTNFSGYLSSIIYLLFSVACWKQVRYINQHMGLIITALQDTSKDADGER